MAGGSVFWDTCGPWTFANPGIEILLPSVHGSYAWPRDLNDVSGVGSRQADLDTTSPVTFSPKERGWLVRKNQWSQGLKLRNNFRILKNTFSFLSMIQNSAALISPLFSSLALDIYIYTVYTLTHICLKIMPTNDTWYRSICFGVTSWGYLLGSQADLALDFCGSLLQEMINGYPFLTRHIHDTFMWWFQLFVLIFTKVMVSSSHLTLVISFKVVDTPRSREGVTMCQK